MNRKSHILVAVAMSVFAFPVLSVGQGSNSTSNGKIQFNVLLPNDVLIPFLSVVVEGNSYRKEISLSTVKPNSIDVPVGIYRVSSESGNYYYDFQRAAFRVQANTVTKVNIFPLLRVRSQMLMGDGSDRYEFAPKPKYDSLPVPASPDASLNMLIRYDKKQRVAGSLVYSSNVGEFRGGSSAKSRGVMVTYDTFAIYADRVRFDPTAFILYADGNVVVEDGQQRIHANTAVVKFKGGVPEIVGLDPGSHGTAQPR